MEIWVRSSGSKVKNLELTSGERGVLWAGLQDRLRLYPNAGWLRVNCQHNREEGSEEPPSMTGAPCHHWEARIRKLSHHHCPLTYKEGVKDTGAVLRRLQHLQTTLASNDYPNEKKFPCTWRQSSKSWWNAWISRPSFLQFSEMQFASFSRTENTQKSWNKWWLQSQCTGWFLIVN